MKFCKDCAHYSPAGGFACMFGGGYWPATCNFSEKRDPVTGEKRITGLCDELRQEGSQCGPTAQWFKPVNLDGRLAMLPEVK